MPPDISRSLNEDPTRLTTTMQFGACRPHALVTAESEQGSSQGRSPNAPLATATAQVKLTPPSGSSSRASGWVFELAHDGLRGINLLAFGLTPGRYGIWLVDPHGRTTALGADRVKHDEILKSFDLPADVRGSQVSSRPRGSARPTRPGRPCCAPRSGDGPAPSSERGAAGQSMHNASIDGFCPSRDA